jgi:hypothetical protein
VRLDPADLSPAVILWLSAGETSFRAFDEAVDVLYKRSKTEPDAESRGLCDGRFSGRLMGADFLVLTEEVVILNGCLC